LKRDLARKFFSQEGRSKLWSDHSQAIELDLQNIRDGGADSIMVSCEWAGKHYEATFTAMAARELSHVGVHLTDSAAKTDPADGLTIKTSCTSAIQGLTGQPWAISFTRAQLQARGVEIDPKSVYEDRGLLTV